ncbi:preprotein translocase subunit SecE [Corticibacter populi]|uniref:Protein translocase subunit SecE n=1 Tax=Corticibacter populi TaxID=1550736 RepID=A0A3M6QFR2_9BURK|nr:preprotein translocase subunit SecE [Corticibacter populi]RMX01936.1 preprotein translocase subunit SecE [Corticibacter populi]RZS29456.1 protein translocase subunit secE/sec61 gamma [Corticibacter populi]
MATSSQIETVGGGVNRLKVGAAFLLVIGAIVAFYLLVAQGAWVQWVALLVGLVLAGIVFLGSDPGRSFKAYVKDSWNELKKVVWPTRKEAVQMTGYVFAFAVIMALFLWLADTTVGWVIYDLLLGWRD